MIEVPGKVKEDDEDKLEFSVLKEDEFGIAECTIEEDEDEFLDCDEAMLEAVITKSEPRYHYTTPNKLAYKDENIKIRDSDYEIMDHN